MADTSEINGMMVGPQDETLAPGTTLLNAQYTIERYLSSGGFGITYLARDSLNRRMVIKECYPEAFCTRQNKTVHARSRGHVAEFQSFVQMFVSEAHKIARLRHPNIVGVHQVFEDNQTAYMALDLIKGQDLLDLIEDDSTLLSPKEIQSILLKLLDAIQLVHSQDMLHRDISPDNILIDQDGTPILIDFGAAREEASKKSRTLSAILVVKDGYSPQEFYFAGSHQSPASDLYALAASFVHLIAGEAPPHSQSRLSATASNQPDPYIPLTGRFEGFAPGFLEAIDKAMNVFPLERQQSAAEWIEQIDPTKRRAAAEAQEKDDEVIASTVKDLCTRARSEAIENERLRQASLRAEKEDARKAKEAKRRAKEEAKRLAKLEAERLAAEEAEAREREREREERIAAECPTEEETLGPDIVSRIARKEEKLEPLVWKDEQRPQKRFIAMCVIAGAIGFYGFGTATGKWDMLMRPIIPSEETASASRDTLPSRLNLPSKGGKATRKPKSITFIRPANL